MRIVSAVALGLCMAVTRVVQADVILESFSGLSYSQTYSNVAGHSATLRATPLVLSYYVNGPSTIAVASGMLNNSFVSSNQTFRINFGKYASSSGGSFSTSAASRMNANWSGVTGIKINVANVTGEVYLAGIDMMSMDSSGEYTGGSDKTDYVAITQAGSYVMSFADLSSYNLSGVNLADVDTLEISFFISSAFSSLRIDSIELVGTVPVPEPSTLCVCGGFFAGALLRRRMK